MSNIDYHDENSAKKGRRNNPDPIIQAKDESGNHKDGFQSSETMLATDKPVPITNVTPLSNIGIEKPAQSANNVIESIFRFKWTILAVFILVAAPLIAAIWTLKTPVYRARAEVRVRPIIPFLVFQTEDSGMIPLYNSFLNTQVSIIRGMTVLQRVLDRPEIQQTKWYKTPNPSLMQRIRGNQTTPMERLLDALYVRPRGGTEIIDVAFVNPNPQEAELIVNTVLEQYIKYIGEMSDDTEDKLYRQLVDQYKSLENDILGREKIVADLSSLLGTGTPEDLISGKRVRLDEAEANLSKLRLDIKVLDWRMKQAVVDDSNDTAIAVEDQSQYKYYEDAEWRKLEFNVRTLRHQIENSGYTEKHPEMIKLKKNMAFAEELLRLRESQVEEQWQKQSEKITNLPLTANAGYTGFKGGVGTLEYQMDQLEYEEKLLVKEVNKKREEFEKLFENAQLLTKENNELQHKRELFDAVRRRLDQKNMERNVPGSIEVLMWGFVSSKPHNDRRIVFTAMAMALGLCMGGGAALLRAGKNQVVYTPQDIPRPIQMPLLGFIPLVNLRKSLGKALSDEIKQKQFLLNESIRVMRTSLLSRLDSRGSATILITSSVAGTGKSSFAIHLGYSMTQVGRSVLMIDTDFHKMSLSECYDLIDKPGFINYLNDNSTEKPYIYTTNTNGLSIMPAGERNAGKIVFEEIAKGSFQKCINKLRRQYQIILLDSSPILPVADSTIMSSQVDGTILVERELVSHRGDVASAIARLNSAGGRLFGFAFVGSVGYQKHGYNGYYNPDIQS